MVPVILIILSVIGIIIVNLLNKDKPAYRIGGTITIILGCALAMLYYYNIRMFRETRTIILTVTLSVALLILAYVLIILLGSYNRGKNEARKKNISKRPVFKSGVKKEKRRQAYNRIEDSDVKTAAALESAKGNKREKRLLIPQEDGAYRTVGDYLNQIETESDAIAGQDDTALKNKTIISEEIDPEDLESAEDWIPIKVSDAELQEYMKAQYAWMEENRPEDELSLSVVFGEDDDAHKEEVPEIIQNYAQQEDYDQDLINEMPNAYNAELGGEYGSIPVNTDYATEDIIDTAQTVRPNEEVAPGSSAEIEYIDINKHEDLLPFGNDNDSIFIDIEDETQSVVPIEANMEWDEPDIVAPYYINAESDAISEKTLSNYKEHENWYAEDSDDEEVASVQDSQTYNIEESEIMTYSGGDMAAVTDNIDGHYVMPGDNIAVYDVDNNMVEENIEEVIEQEVSVEYGPEYLDESAEPVFDGMPVPVVLNEYTDTVGISVENNAFDSESQQSEIAFTTATEQPQELTEAIDEELTEEDISRIQSEQKKQREMDELTELVKAKSYNEAMKKLFEILNSGYVMTPDEKQKMRIVMLTLKAKT